MIPLAAGALAIGIFKGASDIFGGFGKADAMRRETAEQVRRFTRQGERTISTATALGAASGVTADSGSVTTYINDMTTEFTKQLDWMKQAGAAGANASELSGLFNGISDVGGSIFQYGKLNNWYR